MHGVDAQEAGLRSATLTEAGVSRAVRPRREPVLIGWSRTRPDGCSWLPSMVRVFSSTGASAAQAMVPELTSSTRQVFFNDMHDFQAEMAESARIGSGHREMGASARAG